MVTLTLTTAQAEMLLALADDENAATKNRLVDAVLSKGEYHAFAEPLALRSQRLLTLRAAIQGALNDARKN